MSWEKKAKAVVLRVDGLILDWLNLVNLFLSVVSVRKSALDFLCMWVGTS